MKLSRRKASVTDPPKSRLTRILGLVLVVGIAAFGVFYYQDQHVDAGPSLVGRQAEAAEAAVRKAPNNVSARLALGEAYRLDKRLDDALRQYDEILKTEKTNRFALLGRGGILIAKGDLQAAKASYLKITSAQRKGEFAGADPQLQEAYYYLGSIALKQGRPKEAITELTAALNIVRSDSDALYLMGVARLRAGSPQLAVESLKQALRFVPTGWCEPYSELALAYGKLAQVPQATYASGMSDFCLKRPADAKRKLKTASTGPMAVDAMLGLGLIAEAESSQVEAVDWYRKILTVDRTNVTAIAALSRLGVTQTSGPTSTSTTQGPS